MKKRLIRGLKGLCCVAVAAAISLTGIQMPQSGGQGSSTVKVAEAASTTGRVPMWAYMKSGSGKLTTYTTNTLKSAAGYIVPGDYCKILAFYSNGSVKVTYPVSKGNRTAYASMSGFMASTGFTTRTRTLGKKLTAYRRSTGSATIGTVYASDQVLVVGTANGRTQVQYPCSGGYKLGWVPGTYSANVGSNPQGCVDSVSSPSTGKITVTGWAFDRDSLGSSLQIHVYVGGPAGSGAPGYAVTANAYRPDVNKAYPGVGNYHGFSSTISVSKTGSQTIYVYAINVGGGNTNPLLGTKSVNIKGQSTSSGVVANGTYKLVSALNSNYVMDVNGASAANGANVQLYADNNSNAQKFVFTKQSDGYYTIKNAGSGKMLDCYGAGRTNGTNIQQYTSNSSAAQRWKATHVGNGYYTLTCKCNGLLADVSGGRSANGTNIQMYSANGSAAQKWKLVSTSVSNSAGTGTNTNSTAATSAASLQMPLAATRCTWRSYSNWSWGNKNGSGSRVYHLGIDIAGSSDTVMAVGNGTVAKSGFNSANGNYVILKHTISGKTVYSFYAHLASYNVKAGQTVSKGNKIGVVGNTGKSNGKHLHFAMMNSLWSNGSYYGYATYFSGNKTTYAGVTYYNPAYVIQNNRLP